jgi:NAD(P)-dependent dehydrogenase (short-subunit alcohol dehydrogenase family)
MELSLSDKAVVVTGAASGIGAAVAQLAAEAGARLLLTDRNAEALARVAGELGAEAVEADLADPGAPSAIGAAAKARLGRIDGLVNSAGLTTRADFRTATPEIWDRLFAVNSRAAFFLMAEALADMTGRGAPGSIVNILSMNAHCGGPDLAVYAATKGALLTLTRNAANAHLRDRVRVNGINLGWTDTPAERRMQAETLGKGEGWLQDVAEKMPLGRLLGPEEAARLAVFLLSDLSVPMTGVALDLEQWVAGAPPA